MEITILIGLSALRAACAVDATISSRTYPILGGQVKVNASELGGMTDEGISVLPAAPSVKWVIVEDSQVKEESHEEHLLVRLRFIESELEKQFGKIRRGKKQGALRDFSVDDEGDIK